MEFNDKSQEIIKTCIEVHRKLGPGFREIFYQRALSRELGMNNLDHTREEWIDVFYDGLKLGKIRVDFIVEDIMLEIKALSDFKPENFMQTLSYLKASEFRTALLVNFGAKQIQIKRLVDSNKDKFYQRSIK